MGAGKNIFRGAMFTAIYVSMTMIIPFLTFTWLSNLGEVAGSGVSIGLSQAKYQQIVFWIFAFGMLISGTAFFAYSSPSQSIRRGLFALIQVLLNCGYIWSYKFSGALEIDFQLILGGSVVGAVFINLQQMIMIYLGLYFLTIILKTYDLIDFTVNRTKIREARRHGKKWKRNETEKLQEEYEKEVKGE